jgi:hypothetical protein
MNWRNLRGGWGILHVTVWSLLFGIFVFKGAPIVGHAVSENKIDAIEANHTIDNYLRTLTGLKNGSERLDEVFQSLPKNKPLIIFVRGNNPPSDFLGMLVAYLSWPREVRTVKIRNTPVEQAVASIDPSSFAALIFCLVSPPPELGKTIPLGSNVLLLPGSEAKR